MAEYVPLIVATGGPCSGKTELVDDPEIRKRFFALGWRPIIIPEYATLLMNNFIPDAIKIAAKSDAANVKIQKEMLRLYISLYRQALRTASLFPGKKRFILSDRGIMDIAAYCGKKDFEQILRDIGDYPEGITAPDAVIHMVTTAIGAEQFYTCDNNKVRKEKDIDQARAVEKETFDVWRGYPVSVIDNSTDFSGKKERAFAVILKTLSSF